MKNSSFKRVLVVLFSAVVLAISSLPAAAQQNSKNKTASLIPVIALLLADDSRIPIRVGQNLSRRFSSQQYKDGIEFVYPAISNDIEVTLTAEVPQGSVVQILVNGVSIGTLKNGINTLTIPASAHSENIISFQFSDGTSWVITNLVAYIVGGVTSRAEAQLLLARTTFGPKRQELDRVLEIGYDGWLDEQMSLPQTRTLALYQQEIIDRRAVRRQDLINAGVTDPQALENTQLGATQLFATRMDTWWHAAIRGNDQLRQRVAYALSEIFVVTETNPRLIPYFHDVLAENAFGSYHDLLKAVTLTPKMGTYLGMLGNRRETFGEFAGKPDENFAREVMQLFSIGLIELELDGTPRLDAGNTIDTYNQDTVRNFARVFTGWHTGLGGRFAPGWENLPMAPLANEAFWHDQQAKTLLNGQVNEAGLSIEEDFNRAIRNIADHPNVAPFIGTLLIKRLVTSNPSPAYVGRVSAAFNNSNGNMGAMIKAILLDQEAIDGPLAMNGGKPKEPVIGVAQVWRAFNARSGIPYIRYMQPQRHFGQRPFGAPTVFGYYEPNFIPFGPLEGLGLTAPEFKLLDDNVVRTSLDRMYAIATSEGNTGNNGGAEVNSLTWSMQLALGEAVSVADDTDLLLDFLDERLFGGLMSQKLRDVIASHIDSIEQDGSASLHRKMRVEEALVLCVVSPEFNVQR